MTRASATLIGFSAVALWALLAFFTVGSAPVPPFLLNALCFAIGGIAGLAWLMVTGGLRRLAGISLRVYAFGTAGLFGYHFLYFSALRLAPPADTMIWVGSVLGVMGTREEVNDYAQNNLLRPSPRLRNFADLFNPARAGISEAVIPPTSRFIGKAQADLQLRKRFDLLPNVLKIASRFMQHERELFSRITEQRAAAMKGEEPYDRPHRSLRSMGGTFAPAPQARPAMNRPPICSATTPASARLRRIARTWRGMSSAQEPFSRTAQSAFDRGRHLPRQPDGRHRPRADLGAVALALDEPTGWRIRSASSPAWAWHPADRTECRNRALPCGLRPCP